MRKMILGCQAEGGGGLWFGEVRGQTRMNILTHMHENHNERAHTDQLVVALNPQAVLQCYTDPG